MQPEVMIFFAAVIFAVVKIVQLWIIWYNREGED